MLFKLMVGPAFSVDIARTSQAALVVRDAMVEVALLCGPPAGRVPAGLIAGGDQLHDPPRRAVRGRGELLGAPAGSLVVLPALLGGRSPPPCGRQRPVPGLLRWRSPRGAPPSRGRCA